MVKLGQRVLRTPETFGEGKRPMVGRVAYIHPQGRFHSVEFELGGGRVRESFLGVSE